MEGRIMIMNVECKKCGADLLNLENNPSGVKREINETYMGETDDIIIKIIRETTEYLTSYEDIEKYKKFMEQHPPKTTITITYKENGIEKSVNDFNALPKLKKLFLLGVKVKLTATCNKCGTIYSDEKEITEER
jgi:rubrerythrin